MQIRAAQCTPAPFGCAARRRRDDQVHEVWRASSRPRHAPWRRKLREGAPLGPPPHRSSPRIASIDNVTARRLSEIVS